jgi:hypothetical protein
MIFSELKTNFQGLLNRRDLTPSLTTTFFDFGIKRIQRELRVPAMEKKVSFTTDGTANVPVPGDLVEIINIFHQNAYTADKLVKVDYQNGLQAAMSPGDPKVYTRDVSNFVIGPCPAAGETIFITYHSDASTLVDDTDHNWLTDVAPDLLIYAALTYAADYFLDERAQKFEQRYGQIGEALQLMAQQDELLNASITPQWSC